jgi:excisionase family DNA binding protein
MLHTRTIREAAMHFKEADPQTALTESAIRRLLRTGEVPSVRVGKKYLVTLEALEEYLRGDATKKHTQRSDKRGWKIV